MKRRPPRYTLFPCTTLSRSPAGPRRLDELSRPRERDPRSLWLRAPGFERLRRYLAGVLGRSRGAALVPVDPEADPRQLLDRKSTRLNSSHANISYAVFCLKK